MAGISLLLTRLNIRQDNTMKLNLTKKAFRVRFFREAYDHQKDTFCETSINVIYDYLESSGLLSNYDANDIAMDVNNNFYIIIDDEELTGDFPRKNIHETKSNKIIGYA